MTKQEKTIHAIVKLEKTRGSINGITQRDVLVMDDEIPPQQAWTALRYIQLYKEISAQS